MPYYGCPNRWRRYDPSPPERKEFGPRLGKYCLLPADHVVSLRLAAAGLSAPAKSYTECSPAEQEIIHLRLVIKVAKERLRQGWV